MAHSSTASSAAPAGKKGFLGIGFSQWILISMVIGILIGWLAPDFAPALKPFANIFLRMIKSLIVPLLFSTLVVGIAGHGDDMAKVGKLALRSIIYFEVVTTAALAIGLIAVNWVKPGVGVGITAAAAGSADEFKALAAKTPTFASVLEHTVPQSFFEAAAQNEVLQIVFFAIIFAVALARTEGKSKAVMLEGLQSLSDIMFKFVGIVMAYAPIGIGAAIGVTVGKSGLGVLLSLAKLVGTLYVSLIVFVIIVLVPVALIARIPIMSFWRHVKEPWLIAFSTASSEAAFPQAMQTMERFGVPRRIVSFVLPTGYSFNLDGSTLYLAIASVFVAQAAGIDMPLSQQLLMMLTLMLTSKGVAAVPRASLVILSGALAQFGLPLEGIAVILGVDAIMDMARTSVNLLGNCLATAVMARWEGELGEPSTEPLPA
jgi:proton glutamate symport protein